MSQLLAQIADNIRSRQLFGPGERILVAVSGGVDSMVLLHALHKLAASTKWRLSVAHLNHQLRGLSSLADERLVARTAKELHLPLVIEKANVRQFVARRRLSLETAARRLRHDFLARAAGRSGIRHIALAHHLDDQVELFFLRLLRGSGPEGLAGMKWQSPSPSDSHIELVRPLLDQPKATLREYAAAYRIRFREDASNARLDIQRNRVRHELLPLLRRHYQPALEKVILRVTDILGAEAEFVNHAALDWMEKMRLLPPKAGQKKPRVELLNRRSRCKDALASPARKQRESPYVGFCEANEKREEFPAPFHFDQLPLALQRRCVQLQLIALGVVPDFELVEQLRLNANRPVSVSWVQFGSPSAGQDGEGIDAARHRSRSAAFTPLQPTKVRGPEQIRGHSTHPAFKRREHRAPVLFAVRDSQGVVHLRREEVAAFGGAKLELDLGRRGEIEFDGACVCWRKVSRKGMRRSASTNERERRRATTGGAEFFDADKVGSPILLRHWQPGDRFQPIGLAKPVKLQDLFTNQKVPRQFRHLAIVAATAKGEVFWVEGLRIGEGFKLTRATKRRLHWKWVRLASAR